MAHIPSHQPAMPMDDGTNMKTRFSFRLTILTVVPVLLGALSVAVVAVPAAQAASLPCDIYGSAGTPCVAAHSTVRALYAS